MLLLMPAAFFQTRAVADDAPRPEPLPAVTGTMQEPPPFDPNLPAAPVGLPPPGSAAEPPTAAPASSAEPAAPVTAATPETLPEISAKISSVTIDKRSASSRVYLIQNQGPTTNLPAEGRVVLFKNAAGPVMGGLVLKTYPEKNQFAVKNVRDYGNGSLPMEPAQPFTALEKLSDLAPPIPATSTQDRADLKEIAPPAPIAQPATELPPLAASATTAPPVTASPAPALSPALSNDEDDDDESGVAIEEIKPLDKYNNWLTGELGFLRNSDATGTSTTYFAGGGIRYGLSLGKRLLFARPHLQDSLAAEVGVFYYKIVNFIANAGDGYNVMPIIPTLRYNLTLSEEFSLFFYGGIMFNFASGVANANAQVTTNLGAAQLAVGTGALFRLGPNFDGRIDLGYDMLGLGLVLRF